MSYTLVQIHKDTATGDLMYQLLKYKKYSAVEAMVSDGDSIDSQRDGGTVLDSIIYDTVKCRTIKTAGWRIEAIKWLTRHGAAITARTAGRLLNPSYWLSIDIMIMLDDLGVDFTGDIDRACTRVIIDDIASGRIDVNMYGRHVNRSSAEWIEISEHIGVNDDLI